MSGGAYRGGSGFYGDGMSNFALCIRCGDCVVSCEEVGTRGEVETALTMGHLAEAAREYRDPQGESGADSEGEHGGEREAVGGGHGDGAREA